MDEESRRVEVSSAVPADCPAGVRCSLKDLWAVLDGKTVREAVAGRSLVLRPVGENVWLLLSMKEPTFEGSCLVSKEEFARVLKELGSRDA